VNTWGTSWGASWGDSWGADQVISSGGGRRQRRVELPPRAWPAEYLARIGAEDDALLLVIAQMIAAGTIH